MTQYNSVLILLSRVLSLLQVYMHAIVLSLLLPFGDEGKRKKGRQRRKRMERKRRGEEESERDQMYALNLIR